MSNSVRLFEHVELGVPDVAEASTFYRDVVGMAELGADGETVYLGFGLDDNYDLALSPGVGIKHFAFRVDGTSELDERMLLLERHGIPYERRDDVEYNQREGVRFKLPSGHTMEFVTVADDTYPVPSRPRHHRGGSILPLDNDHLGLMTNDVRALAEFLCDVLGFTLTEYVEPDRGSGLWVLAFVRGGPYHHDISIALGEETLHHYAVMVSSFEHIKVACDVLAGTGHPIEWGPGRHPAGANLFMYALLPGGHRVEFSAEMAMLHERVEAVRSPENSMDAWGDSWKRVPDHFFRGS